MLSHRFVNEYFWLAGKQLSAVAELLIQNVPRMPFYFCPVCIYSTKSLQMQLFPDSLPLLWLLLVHMLICRCVPSLEIKICFICFQSLQRSLFDDKRLLVSRESWWIQSVFTWSSNLSNYLFLSLCLDGTDRIFVSTTCFYSCSSRPVNLRGPFLLGSGEIRSLAASLDFYGGARAPRDKHPHTKKKKKPELRKSFQ